MDKIDLRNYNILILAAGTGSRIGKRGKKLPKSLFEIREKKIIDYLFELLIKKQVKKINIMTGYKSRLIKNYLKKYKKIKIFYKNINNYSKNGHSFTWYKFKQLWKNSRKSTILFHADILFSEKYLDNLIKSNYENIIGIKKITKKLDKEIFYISEDKLFVKKISKIPNITKPIGEVIGINKISYQLMRKIFLFMDNYFKNKKNKKLSWEIVINDFIQENPKSFKILKNQNFPWININRIKDYHEAKKIF